MINNKFKLGEYVRWLHDFDAKDVACDIGHVIAISGQYMGTDKQRVWYQMRFDKPVFKKPKLSQVYAVTVEESKLELV